MRKKPIQQRVIHPCTNDDLKELSGVMVVCCSLDFKRVALANMGKGELRSEDSLTGASDIKDAKEIWQGLILFFLISCLFFFNI